MGFKQGRLMKRRRATDQKNENVTVHAGKPLAIFVLQRHFHGARTHGLI
jgi:hypothetical protein